MGLAPGVRPVSPGLPARALGSYKTRTPARNAVLLLDRREIVSRYPLDLALPARICQAVTAELGNADEGRTTQAPVVRDDWHERQELYRTARGLRVAVEELWGPIRGEEGNEIRCGANGFIEQDVWVQGLPHFKVTQAYAWALLAPDREHRSSATR